MRTPLAIAAVSTLALAACGSDGDDADQLPDADELIDDAEELEAEADDERPSGQSSDDDDLDDFLKDF